MKWLLQNTKILNSVNFTGLLMRKILVYKRSSKCIFTVNDGLKISSKIN